MKWITLETTEELSKVFVDSLNNYPWNENKSKFFKKEHNCSVLMKEEDGKRKFIITSTHDEFTEFITTSLSNCDIQQYRY